MNQELSSGFYPPPLAEGGTIAVVAPSRWAEKPRLMALKEYLESQGYKVFLHSQNNKRAGWLAGSAPDRAAALMEMFCDPSIDAIMCARGGTGAIHLLELLDYDVIRANSKPFIGFSDVTCLLHAITEKTGMVTYHGPMSWQNGHFDSRSFSDLFHVIGQKSGTRKLVFPDATVLREGRIRGTMVGGNMMLLQSLVGTDYAFRPQESILFIEDVDEALYVLDRTLAHLRLSGLFKSVQAVMVGDMCLIEDQHPDPALPPEAWYGKTIEEIVLSHVPHDIPVVFHVPCGHTDYMTTLPVGGIVNVTFSSSGLSCEF